MPSELVTGNRSRQKIFQCLEGLRHDWRLRGAGAKEARLSALEAEQKRSKRFEEIKAHLDTLDDDELDPRLRQYQRATGRLQMGKTYHFGRGR